MKPKMTDIARLAGVSTTAVSLALNGKKGISQETRKKIFKVINKYDYEPLRTRKKGNMRKVAKCDLIIVSDKNGVVNRNYHSLPFFDRLVETLAQNINGFGANLQIDTLRIDHLMKDLDDLLENSSVTNAIVLGTDLSKDDVQLINKKIQHTVFVDTYYQEVNADFVAINNFQGAYMAAQYIINHGFKEIGYAATSKNNPSFLMRQAGFSQALTEAHLSIKDGYFYKIEASDLTTLDSLKGFSTKNLPEIIFCDTDYMAIRIMKECKKNHIKIPADLSIIGFDDIDEADMVNPELTTVHASVNQIVNQAIFQLQSQISQKRWESQNCLVNTHLVERNSVKLK